jgi:hypothetical protein
MPRKQSQDFGLLKVTKKNIVLPTENCEFKLQENCHIQLDLRYKGITEEFAFSRCRCCLEEDITSLLNNTKSSCDKVFNYIYQKHNLDHELLGKRLDEHLKRSQKELVKNEEEVWELQHQLVLKLVQQDQINLRLQILESQKKFFEPCKLLDLGPNILEKIICYVYDYNGIHQTSWEDEELLPPSFLTKTFWNDDGAPDIWNAFHEKFIMN